MKTGSFVALICIFLPVNAFAADPHDMVGIWRFDPALSRNVGSMAQATVITSITLRGDRLTVDDASRHLGQDYRQRTIYALSGLPMANTSQMGGACTTVSHWTNEHLKTDWACPGAFAGATTHRSEDRYLAHYGTLMIVRTQGSGAVPIIMTFVRK